MIAEQSKFFSEKSQQVISQRISHGRVTHLAIARLYAVACGSDMSSSIGHYVDRY